MNINYIQPFGYCEMYQIDENLYRYGRFVTFDNDNPGYVKFAKPNDYIIGVTSINFNTLSDNPQEWQSKYLRDEYGDALMYNKTIVRGIQEYDELEEFSYIKTYKDTEYSPIPNENYNKDLNYENRLDRKNWIPVNLIGKCIVEDNGECQPGDWCELYNGDDDNLQGTAIKSNNSNHKYYVIKRITEKTILILFK